MKDIDKKATKTLFDLAEKLKKGDINMNEYTHERDRSLGKQTFFESLLLPAIGVYVEKSRSDTDE